VAPICPHRMNGISAVQACRDYHALPRNSRHRRQALLLGIQRLDKEEHVYKHNSKQPSGCCPTATHSNTRGLMPIATPASTAEPRPQRALKQRETHIVLRFEISPHGRGHLSAWHEVDPLSVHETLWGHCIEKGSNFGTTSTSIHCRAEAHS
jgi:hypothetical protein